MLLTALVSVFTLSSCFNSDTGERWDWACFATVQETYMGVYLSGDDGVTYYPTNPDYLRLNTSDGSVKYAERVFVYMKYVEETGTTPKAKSKNVTIVSASGIPVRSLCDRPDTIKNTLPLATFNAMGVTRGYVTVDFALYYAGGNISFDLFPEKVEGDLLTLRLKQTYGKDAYGTNPQGYLMSFKMPNFDNLQNQIQDLGLDPLTPEQDSIYVKVIATGSNDSDLTLDSQLKFRMGIY